MEGIGFLEKITRGPQPELLDDLVVGFDAVGRSRGVPGHGHVKSLVVAVELLAEVHVRHECGARVTRGFVDVENFLGRLLGTRGVRTVGGGERQSFQSLTGLDGIGDARLGQRRIRPSLQTVVSVEIGLSVTDQMQMKNHGSDYVTIPAVSVRVAGSHKS